MSTTTAALIAAVACLTVLPAVRALRGERRRLGLGDRAGAVEGVATAVFGTVLARQALPWDVLPAALWVVPVAATAATVLGGALLWRSLPTFAGPRWRRAAGAGTSVVLALALVAALAAGWTRHALAMSAAWEGEIAGLRRRVEALEAAAGVDPSSGTTVDHPPAAAAAPAAPPPSGDELWALDGLRARLPGGTGGVLLTGAVPLADGGRAVWQQGHPVEAVLDADVEVVARRLQALASEVRLRLLREVLAGRGGSGDLAADPQFGTSGQVQHHLRLLVAAGWLRSTARGRYAVPGERVVPLLVAMAAAGL